MSVQYHGSKEQAINSWKSLCVKNGLPEAASILGSNTSSLNTTELHELRKTVRRAVNKISDSIKPNQYDDATTDGLLFGAEVIQSVNASLERFEDAERFFGKKQKTDALKNSADFERYFGTPENIDRDETFGIADLLRGVANLKSSPSVHNALAAGTDSTGGYAVPSHLMPGILSAMVPVSSLLQAGVGIVPLEEGAKTFTTAAVNTIPTAAWRAEAGAVATSDPAFRAVVATPRSLAFQFKISRELLADGQNIQEALNNAIAQAFAKELDRVGLRGSGTAPEPRGLLNTSGIQSVTNGTNGASLASYANLFSATQALLQADAPMPTAAIMSPRSLVKLGGLTDSTGQPLRVPDALKSLKLIATSQIPNNLTVGSSSDCSEIYLGDFSNMYFAMRENVSIQLLQELYAGTGEIGFACHMRADVVVQYPAAFSVVTGVKA
jgi:HK97 family phage major capsid protein